MLSAFTNALDGTMLSATRGSLLMGEATRDVAP